jgi:hypothetical protein
MEISINAIHTRQGVNMGDHAQDTIRAGKVDPTMTVQELCEALLTKKNWRNKEQGDVREADPDAFLIIRLEVPINPEGDF